MKVGYKTILRGELSQLFPSSQIGDIIAKEADLEYMLSSGTLTPCCEKMRDSIKDANIIFDWAVCCNFNARWSEGEGENVSIDYCPFCGEQITLEEVKRVKRVNRPKTIPAKTVDNWIEEEV